MPNADPLSDRERAPMWKHQAPPNLGPGPPTSCDRRAQAAERTSGAQAPALLPGNPRHGATPTAPVADTVAGASPAGQPADETDPLRLILIVSEAERQPHTAPIGIPQHELERNFSERQIRGRPTP